ncbi:MAG: hypothetical protein HZB33_10985 [Nitrospirae bacterium]|nr:hypothetical protein [Nitrospirota bacterium]
MQLLRKILNAGKARAEMDASIQDVIDNLRLISKGERDVGEFYRLCGEVLTDDKEFWIKMAASERAHAEIALRMAALVETEPFKYRPGRAFSAVLIRLFGLHLSNLVESMRAGEIKKDELLTLAADIENSVVELNYGEIVETEVPEFLAMARLLEEETGAHRQSIEKMIKNSRD